MHRTARYAREIVARLASAARIRLAAGFSRGPVDFLNELREEGVSRCELEPSRGLRYVHGRLPLVACLSKRWTTPVLPAR
jgi:hypothetical protein